MANEYTAT